jgi:cellulose synthase/poly-beta-1,6-N-acetylglucosamine synthase-like glycosyltransferase
MDAMLQSPLVSLIIPMRNEGDHIRPCLESALAQDYPADRLEILVVDGRSSDHSRDVAVQYAQRHPNVRLLDNPRRITPAAFNVGIRQARGEIVGVVSAHSVLAPDYVKECVAALQRSGAAEVGGRMQPVGKTYVGQAVALGTTSPFGVGDSWFHYDAREQFVDTVYMGVFRREILDRVGLFDEELIRNQDYEINVRIRKAGGKILLSPKITSHYTPRSSLPTLWRQYFQYGRWKVATLRKHPDSLRWRQVAAPLFVSFFFGSLLLGLFWLPARWLLALIASCYLLVNLAASTIAAMRGGWRYLPILPIVFTTIHFAWGLGFWYGLMLIPSATKR